MGTVRCCLWCHGLGAMLQGRRGIGQKRMKTKLVCTYVHGVLLGYRKRVSTLDTNNLSLAKLDAWTKQNKEPLYLIQKRKMFKKNFQQMWIPLPNSLFRLRGFRHVFISQLSLQQLDNPTISTFNCMIQ